MNQPILIVGAGPTGLTAALESWRLDCPVRLIHRRREPDGTSPAIGIQARTLELMQQRGLADEMVRLGIAPRAAGRMARCRHCSIHRGSRCWWRMARRRIR